MHRSLTSIVICSMCFGTQGFAAALDVVKITSVDDLGYACIDEAYFVENDDSASIAFLTGGKIRLPRTCVENPCDAALTQRELSQLTGTDPNIPRFAGEWNDYYARYADYCRKETTPDGGVVAESDDDFWERTRRPAQIAQTISQQTSQIPVLLGSTSAPSTVGEFTPIGFNTDLGISNFTTPNLFAALATQAEDVAEARIGESDFGEVLSSSETATSDTQTSLTAITAVPLPNSLAMMIASLFGFGLLTRRRS